MKYSNTVFIYDVRCVVELIKLLALDLDGTLTNSKKEVSKKNIKYIRKAQDAGVKVILASGRPVIGIKGIADSLDLWQTGGYILAYNGGQIIDCATGHNLVKVTIPQEYNHEICGVTRKFKVYPLTYNDVGVICEIDTDQYVKKEAYNNGISVIKVADLENEVTEPVVKFMVVGDPIELNKAYKYLKKLLNGKLNVFFSEPYFMEITPLGIEKSSALSKLSNILGYTSENVMACGDGLNDITMLQYAGIAVAMDNAYEETKKYADYISASNEMDGVALAINKFILKGEGLC